VNVLTETLGTVRGEGEGRLSLHFERTYDCSLEELWSAVTKPDRLARWLGPTEIDLRGGGAVVIRFGDDEDQTVRGVIRDLAPPNVLEYSWTYPGEDESVLRLELEPRGEATLLVLDHRRLAAKAAAGYGAGWHSYLDALERSLAGEEHDWQTRFDAVLPQYVERAAALRS
jgi:uncharacterized protein YndB with AHSA1/START domain